MATYYINADSGDDGTGDGSSGNPWETLAHAFDQTIVNDTIVAQDSTALYDYVADTFDHNITIEGEQDDGSGALFDGGGVNATWNANTGSTTIQKLTIQNTLQTTGASAGVIRFGVDCQVLNVSNVNFVGNSLNSSSIYGGLIGSAGLPAMASQCAINVDNCLINNPIDVGLSASDRSIFVTRHSANTVTFNVTNCTLYFEESTNYISNVFSDSVNDALVEFNCTNTVIRNNTGLTLNYNVIGSDGSIVDPTYGCFNNITFLGTAAAGANSITDDPLFVDESSGNFELRPSSPCIDTGTLV